jgi:hypothetical protein
LSDEVSRFRGRAGRDFVAARAGLSPFSDEERVHQRAQRRKRGACVVERRFKRYGQWAGLAFWLYLTRGWVEDGLPG